VGLSIPSFNDYFEYLRLQEPDNTALADNWLFDKFSDKSINDLMYSDYTEILTEFKAPTADFDGTLPYEFEGDVIAYHDKPALIYHDIQRAFSKSQSAGLKLTSTTFYSVAGKPVYECMKDLNYYHADIMVKHHMTFFRKRQSSRHGGNLE
jgi:uncharacterized short protein YbdD (DUF466 family)